MTLEIVSKHAHRSGRTTYHLARLRIEDGVPTVDPVRTMGSGDVASLSRVSGRQWRRPRSLGSARRARPQAAALPGR